LSTWLVPEWPVPRAVRALSTWRSGGTSSGVYASLNLGSHVGDDDAAVAENRRLLGRAAGLPAEPCWLRQVHGSKVADLDAPPSAAPLAPQPGQDAAITRQRGRVCAILTADCMPVLFASADGGLIGAAHAGWRGLAAGVLEEGVRALAEVGGASAARPRGELGGEGEIRALIGPGAGPCCYEVGEEVHAAFGGAGRVGARNIDLAGLARERLCAAGVRRVESVGVCTICDERLYSHRREGERAGRQAGIAWLG
jgi:polyphenol oxidase